MIKLVCTKCGKHLEAPDAAAGGQGKCSDCKTVFGIPAGDDVANESTPGEETTNDMKKCPYCAEDIKKEAVKCRYCGSEIEEQKKEKEGIQLKCGKCEHSFVLPKETAGKESTCPNCGMSFDVPGSKEDKKITDTKVTAGGVGCGFIMLILLLIFGFRACDFLGTSDAMTPVELQAFNSEMQQINTDPSIKDVIHYAKAEIKGTTLRIDINFIEPTTMQVVELLLRHCAQLAVETLMNQGVCPKERRMMISVWGQREGVTATGATGVRLYGVARYLHLTDRIEFEPYNR